MSSAHQIDKLTFKLRQVSVEQVQPVSKEIYAFKEEMLRKLEKIFDEYIPADQWITFDRITLDLGHLPSDGFGEQYQQRVIQLLKKELKVLSQHVLSTDNYQIQDVTTSQAGMLAQYFKQGHQSHLEQLPHFDLNNYTEKLLFEKPSELANALRLVWNTASGKKRMQQQLRPMLYGLIEKMMIQEYEINHEGATIQKNKHTHNEISEEGITTALLSHLFPDAVWQDTPRKTQIQWAEEALSKISDPNFRQEMAPKLSLATLNQLFGHIHPLHDTLIELKNIERTLITYGLSGFVRSSSFIIYWLLYIEAYRSTEKKIKVIYDLLSHQILPLQPKLFKNIAATIYHQYSENSWHTSHKSLIGITTTAPTNFKTHLGKIDAVINFLETGIVAKNTNIDAWVNYLLIHYKEALTRALQQVWPKYAVRYRLSYHLKIEHLNQIIKLLYADSGWRPYTISIFDSEKAKVTIQKHKGKVRNLYFAFFNITASELSIPIDQKSFNILLVKSLKQTIPTFTIPANTISSNNTTEIHSYIFNNLSNKSVALFDHHINDVTYISLLISQGKSGMKELNFSEKKYRKALSNTLAEKEFWKKRFLTLSIHSTFWLSILPLSNISQLTSLVTLLMPLRISTLKECKKEYELLIHMFKKRQLQTLPQFNHVLASLLKHWYSRKYQISHHRFIIDFYDTIFLNYYQKDALTQLFSDKTSNTNDSILFNEKYIHFYQWAGKKITTVGKNAPHVPLNQRSNHHIFLISDVVSYFLRTHQLPTSGHFKTYKQLLQALNIQWKVWGLPVPYPSLPDSVSTIMLEKAALQYLAQWFNRFSHHTNYKIEILKRLNKRQLQQFIRHTQCHAYPKYEKLVKALPSRAIAEATGIAHAKLKIHLHSQLLSSLWHKAGHLTLELMAINILKSISRAFTVNPENSLWLEIVSGAQHKVWKNVIDRHYLQKGVLATRTVNRITKTDSQMQWPVVAYYLKTGKLLSGTTTDDQSITLQLEEVVANSPQLLIGLLRKRHLDHQVKLRLLASVSSTSVLKLIRMLAPTAYNSHYEMISHLPHLKADHHYRPTGHGSWQRYVYFLWLSQALKPNYSASAFQFSVYLLRQVTEEVGTEKAAITKWLGALSNIHYQPFQQALIGYKLTASDTSDPEQETSTMEAVLLFYLQYQHLPKWSPIVKVEKLKKWLVVDTQQKQPSSLVVLRQVSKMPHAIKTWVQLMAPVEVYSLAKKLNAQVYNRFKPFISLSEVLRKPFFTTAVQWHEFLQVTVLKGVLAPTLQRHKKKMISSFIEETIGHFSLSTTQIEQWLTTFDTATDPVIQQILKNYHTQSTTTQNITYETKYETFSVQLKKYLLGNNNAVKSKNEWQLLIEKDLNHVDSYTLKTLRTFSKNDQLVRTFVSTVSTACLQKVWTLLSNYGQYFTAERSQLAKGGKIVKALKLPRKQLLHIYDVVVSTSLLRTGENQRPEQLRPVWIKAIAQETNIDLKKVKRWAKIRKTKQSAIVEGLNQHNENKTGEASLQVETDTLIYVLRYQKLPWWHTLEVSNTTVAMEKKRLIALFQWQNLPILIRAINNSPDERHLIEQLISVIDLSGFNRLVNLLVPGMEGYIVGFTTMVEKLAKNKYPSLAYNNAPELYLYLYQIMRKNKGSLTAKVFTHEATKRIGKQYKINLDVWLQQVLVLIDEQINRGQTKLAVLQWVLKEELTFASQKQAENTNEIEHKEWNAVEQVNYKQDNIAVIIHYLQYGTISHTAGTLNYDKLLDTFKSEATTKPESLKRSLHDALARPLALKKLLLHNETFPVHVLAFIYNCKTSDIYAWMEGIIGIMQHVWSGKERSTYTLPAYQMLFFDLKNNHTPSFDVSALLVRYFKEIKRIVPDIYERLHKGLKTYSPEKRISTLMLTTLKYIVEQETAIKPRPTLNKPWATSFSLKKNQIPIKNVGMVIFANFLPRYFEMLEMTYEDKKVFFHDSETAARAAQLLHYMACGETIASDDDRLMAKILSGVDLAYPLQEEIILTEKERQISEQLLIGVLQNWDKLKSDSVEALQEGFLMRDGFLHETTHNWEVKVKESGKDILIDFLPWSIKTIKHSWMQKIISVEWRKKSLF